MSDFFLSSSSLSSFVCIYKVYFSFLRYEKKKTNIKLHDVVIYDAYPDVEQKLWPAHCIQNTDGAKFHPDLKMIEQKSDKMSRGVVHVRKGTKPDIDSYSAFFDNCKLNETTLNDDLKKHAINELYICGLAADVCVGKKNEGSCFICL
jgi:nicotinamidase-related amidase